MPTYIHFTDEQKYRANNIDLADFLRQQGEQLTRSGYEWRWNRHDSVTVRGNRWYRHSAQEGGYPIDFVRKFYDMSFPEAVTFLLDGEGGSEFQSYDRQEKNQERKEFILPPAHTDLRRVYAYLTKRRWIDRDVISHFAREKTLYEDSEYHNAVFVGLDENGVARHAHKKGTYSEGRSYRGNVAGSLPQYSFRHMGAGDVLHAFEAPTDLLSYLSLHPEDWRRQSYVALNGVSEYAMLNALEQYPHIQKIRLCLDHDPAGIEATGRLAGLLREKEYRDVAVCLPRNKDWNEDLKEKHGVEPVTAVEHPKIEACHMLLDELAAACSCSDGKPVPLESITADYKRIARLTQDGRVLQPEHAAILLDCLRSMAAGALLRVVADSRQMEMPVSVEQLVRHLRGNYTPHRDREQFRAKLDGIRQTISSVEAKRNAKGIRTLDNRRAVLFDTTRLALECVQAQICIQMGMQEFMQTQEETLCVEDDAPIIAMEL